MSLNSTTRSGHTNQSQKNFLGIFLLIIISGVYYWYLTDKGLVLNPDSVVYLGVAHNLSIGNGLRVPFGLPPQIPLAQFPPLLSMILFGIAKLGLSLELSARLLNLTLLSVLLIILGKFQRQITNKYPLFRFALLAYVAVYLLTTFLFTTLASEPLMIALGLSGILFWLVSEEKSSIFYLLLASIFFALTIMTRYAGITYLAAAGLMLLLFSHNSWIKKLGKIFILCLPTLIFLFIWLLRSTGAESTSTNRIFLIHPIRVAQISAALTTISNWFLVPENSPIILKLMVAFIFSGIILIIFIYSLRKNNETGSNFLPKTLLAFFFSYPLFLLFSITFLDANIPLDKRLLSPIFVLIPLVLLLFVQSFSKKVYLTKYGVTAITLLFLGLSTFMFIQNRIFSQQVHELGFGFNYAEFKNDPLFNYLSHVDQPAIFISNAAEPVYLFTQHEVFFLPKRFNSMENRENQNFDAEIAKLKEKYLLEPTYFIFFEKITGGNNEDQKYYQSQFRLHFVEKFDNASLYSYLPAPTP